MNLCGRMVLKAVIPDLTRGNDSFSRCGQWLRLNRQ